MKNIVNFNLFFFACPDSNCCSCKLLVNTFLRNFSSYEDRDGEPYISGNESHLANHPSHIEDKRPHYEGEQSHFENQQPHHEGEQSHFENQQPHHEGEQSHFDDQQDHLSESSPHIADLPDYITGQFPAEEQPSVLESIFLFPFFRANDLIAKFFAFSISFFKNHLPGIGAVIIPDEDGIQIKLLFGETIKYNFISMGEDDPHQQESISGGAISTDAALKNHQRGIGI